MAAHTATQRLSGIGVAAAVLTAHLAFLTMPIAEIWPEGYYFGLGGLFVQIYAGLLVDAREHDRRRRR